MPPPGQTQLPDWDGLKLRVRTLIASHRVMIFSKSYCPYCHKVRRRRGSARRAAPRALSPGRRERGLWERLPSPRARREASAGLTARPGGGRRAAGKRALGGCRSSGGLPGRSGGVSVCIPLK